MGMGIELLKMHRTVRDQSFWWIFIPLRTDILNYFPYSSSSVFLPLVLIFNLLWLMADLNWSPRMLLICNMIQDTRQWVWRNSLKIRIRKSRSSSWIGRQFMASIRASRARRVFLWPRWKANSVYYDCAYCRGKMCPWNVWHHFLPWFGSS